MRKLEIRSASKINFGNGDIEANVVLGRIETDLDVDQLIAAVNFKMAVCVDPAEVEAAAPASPGEGQLPGNTTDPSLGGSESASESDSDQDQDSEGDSSTAIETVIDDEGTVEALKAAGLFTVESVREYVDGGKDLVELDSIGTTRKKRILIAIGR